MSALDFVAVPDHCTDNIHDRGEPRHDLDHHAMTEYLAQLVLDNEHRAGKERPPIEVDDYHDFVVHIAAGTGPLCMRHDIVLVVREDFVYGKKWAIVTCMRKYDYEHRCQVTAAYYKPGKIPGSRPKGLDILRRLTNGLNEKKQMA